MCRNRRLPIISKKPFHTLDLNERVTVAAVITVLGGGTILGSRLTHLLSRHNLEVDRLFCTVALRMLMSMGGFPPEKDFCAQMLPVALTCLLMVI